MITVLLPAVPTIRPVSYGTLLLFCLITLIVLIGVPAFGYVSGYTMTDWVMFGLLYLATGLGITVGYHRLIAHRSFACPDWVKIGLLIVGGWALENSALKWAATHRRHMRNAIWRRIPTTPSAGFGTVIAVGSFSRTPTPTRNIPLVFDRMRLWCGRAGFMCRSCCPG